VIERDVCKPSFSPILPLMDAVMNGIHMVRPKILAIVYKRGEFSRRGFTVEYKAC